jgi:regulator of chromosome condensation
MLALDSHGAIFAWGCGQQSQLGRPVMENYRIGALNPSLVRIPRAKSKSKITAISAGQFHSFALTATGDVYAWGLNNFAQTGIAPKPAGEDGEQDPSSLIVPKPKPVESLGAHAGGEHGAVAALAGGNHHSLALTSAGHVLSWGRCDASQAGVPLSSLPTESLVFDDRGKARILARPTPIPGLEDVAFVATGIDNGIAITADGKAYAWGFSANYRTGLGTEEPVEEPTLVENSAVKGKRLTWAGCGGQFSVLAGPAGN